MISIKEALVTAMEIATSNTPVVKVVSDDDIARAIVHLGIEGYIPNETTVEIMRAFMGGYALLLTGSVGVGKTFLMQCLGGRIYDAKSIAEYGIRNVARWYEWTDKCNVCIDDLGAEPTCVEYGARDEVLSEVIAHRARYCTKVKTHVTSNLSAAQIAARYGDRTLDRLLGMCKAFRMDGASMREASPLRQ